MHLFEHRYKRPKVLEEIMKDKALGAFAKISERKIGILKAYIRVDVARLPTKLQQQSFD